MIISKTPLRASFFGGGTDFKDYYENSRYGYGAVISTALNMYVYIMVCKRFDSKIRVCYTKNEFVDSVDQIKHNIIREALKITGIENGIDIVYAADIPLSSAGIGLASSSALAVGVLNALYAFKGEYASPEKLARTACEIEINRLGNPIGIQDQYACAYGGFRVYKFWADGTVSATPVNAPQNHRKALQDHLLLYYTGQTRISSEILSEQKENIPSKNHVLDCMLGMVEEALQNVSSGNIEKWGEMLDEAWNMKKSLASKISNQEIDLMYEKAKEAGAAGGKVLGAGGGGFLLLYVSEENKEHVRDVLQKYREVTVSFENEGSRIIFMEDNHG